MKKTYVCRRVTLTGADDAGIPWDSIEAMALVDVVDGGPPRLRTDAKACWTERALHIRFECEDDHVVATMSNRDDPLYDEDVVEVFIDEQGAGRTYMEFEISPRNVVFDAVITNDGTGRIKLDLDWNAEGLETGVFAEGSRTIVEMTLPFANAGKVPEHGTEWRWNLYRIDAEADGRRHFWAWSPTGAVDFHLADHFGVLRFSSDPIAG